MRVAIVSFEVYPLAKVGGLADVAGALPKALKKKGTDVSIFMPFHKKAKDNVKKLDLPLEKVLDEFDLGLYTTEKASLFKTILPKTDIPVYLVDNAHYFSSEDVYGSPDGGEQAIFFTKAVLEAMKKMEKHFDVIHANDWQTGLLPVYLKSVYSNDPFFAHTASVYTIHNLGYQGIFDRSYMGFAKLPDYLFNIDGVEFYGNLNFMKGGIVFSDIVNTVSPTYAQEITTPEYGEKLEGVLQSRSEVLYGVLNGIDYEENDPSSDKRIPYHYSVDNMDGKWKDKEELQKEMGLDVKPEVPLVGLISRLVDQKGLDLIDDVMKYVMNCNVQFVLLGTGDKKYEDSFSKLAREFPGKASVKIGFDINLAQRIYAGCDFFLMPSRYEPCGLGQMYSLRYGTIPIVRYTGGLADTVEEFDGVKGNGFGFKPYDSAYLARSILKALYFYHRKDEMKTLIRNAMMTDLSWERSADEYLKLYELALKNH
ncbi:glycogen synthase [Mesoaciditoga sp.]